MISTIAYRLVVEFIFIKDHGHGSMIFQGENESKGRYFTCSFFNKYSIILGLDLFTWRLWQEQELRLPRTLCDIH